MARRSAVRRTFHLLCAKWPFSGSKISLNRGCAITFSNLSFNPEDVRKSKQNIAGSPVPLDSLQKYTNFWVNSAGTPSEWCLHTFKPLYGKLILVNDCNPPHGKDRWNVLMSNRRNGCYQEILPFTKENFEKKGGSISVTIVTQNGTSNIVLNSC